MRHVKRLLSVPTWLRMRLAGTELANMYTHLNVWVYQATEGRLWGHLYVPDTSDLMPILLLETRGRRTGRSRVTPLIYCQRDGAFLLAAANAGHRRHPGWFLNLRAQGRVRVQVGKDQFPAVAREVPPSERDAAFAVFASAYPPLRSYQRATARQIPMVLLERQPALPGLQPPQ